MNERYNDGEYPYGFYYNPVEEAIESDLAEECEPEVEREPIPVGIEAERAPADGLEQELVDRTVHELFRRVLDQHQVDLTVASLLRR